MIKVKEFFLYNHKTGELQWKGNQRNRLKTGQRTVNVPLDSGGADVYKIARLCWVMHYGEWPEDYRDIEYIDGNEANNQICNLRLVKP